MDSNLPVVQAQCRGGENGRANIARKKKEGLEMLLAFFSREERSASGTGAAALRSDLSHRDPYLKKGLEEHYQVLLELALKGRKLSFLDIEVEGLAQASGNLG